MHNMQDKLGIKNMSDLTIKAIKGIYDAETLTKEQIRKHEKIWKKNL